MHLPTPRSDGRSHGAFTVRAILLAFALAAAAAQLAAIPLPSVFLIGDSISIQYHPYLADNLRPIAAYDRKQGSDGAAPELQVPSGPNGGDSRMVLAYLRTREGDPAFRPEYLLVNAGLHDIKRNAESGEIQVGIENYRSNLEEICALAGRIGADLVWITTTAVEDERHNRRSRFHRYDRDRAAYDAVAREVMTRHGVPIIDLYAFTIGLPGERYVDHVHYDEPTRALQAAFIAGALQQML